ncbi:hypothetical protein BpHYR1_024247 [Brachionus plicatilis]|uniref:Uncharacterized protein n=1 Tax=Brachionus plicatilis TaxID=10195 RepID=A0A3M7RTX7_BRAPC|nr:hypothetical protein BpHYR1_024247 [Brachionus plicatilis]
MPPDSKSALGHSSKKSTKPSLKITQDEQRLTIDLVGREVERPQKHAPKTRCLAMFEKRRPPSPASHGFKHLKEIISQANDSWSHFFLPLIHLGNLDPNREKLDALRTEIDRTMNEISTFKNKVLQTDSLKLVRTTEVGINTDISMSNAVFKIKYEDEEDEPRESDVPNYGHMAVPLIESPSDTNSYHLPALTLVKNFNKKYNMSSVNESDVSSPDPRRNNSTIQPKTSHFESDSLDKSRHNQDCICDDGNIFRKIFSRNFDREQRVPYVNLEPIKKKLDSSSSLASSSSDAHDTRRASKILKKRESWLNEERKRHSLKKLPVHDFGPSKRDSSEYKLKMIPLQKCVEQTRFHCCCCKCTCADVPVYKTVTTTTTTKIPASSLQVESSSSDTLARSSDQKKNQHLNSYYFKSTRNHRKKNEFGLLSQAKNASVDRSGFDCKQIMPDSLEERGKGGREDEFKFFKDLIDDTESNSDGDFQRIQNNIKFILDSLHRPHSAFQCAEDRTHMAPNLKESNFGANINHQDSLNQSSSKYFRFFFSYFTLFLTKEIKINSI